jgi:hypothetical protein
MNTHGLDILALARKVARIYDDQQLNVLENDYAADCRGLCSDSAQLHTAAELLRVRSVANTLAQLLEFPRAEIEPLVRSALLPHPRRESAVRLIDEYTRDANAFDKLAHERAKRQHA